MYRVFVVKLSPCLSLFPSLPLCVSLSQKGGSRDKLEEKESDASVSNGLEATRVWQVCVNYTWLLYTWLQCTCVHIHCTSIVQYLLLTHLQTFTFMYIFMYKHMWIHNCTCVVYTCIYIVCVAFPDWTSFHPLWDIHVLKLAELASVA